MLEIRHAPYSRPLTGYPPGENPVNITKTLKIATGSLLLCAMLHVMRDLRCFIGVLRIEPNNITRYCTPLSNGVVEFYQWSIWAENKEDKIMKIITLVLTGLLYLTGCGGGGGGGDDEPVTQPVETVAEVNVDTSASIQNVGITAAYNLTITGDANTITVNPDGDIRRFILEGDANQVTIEPGTTIQAFEVIGNSNIVWVPAGSGITFESTGFSNILQEL